MRRILTIPTAVVVTVLALAGCSAGSADYSSTDQSGGGVSAPMTDGVTSDSSESTVASPVDRQVITTGWVTITVDEPMDAAAKAITITEQVGGRVDGRSEYAPVDGDKGSATLTLRLPADGLNETLDKFKQLGDVQEISLNSQDVTMVTQDLDARIKAMSASIDRLLALLSTASDTDTLITLETAISDRQAQLESMQSEQRYYADQVALSTVTLNLVSVADAPVETPNNFFSGLAAGWNAFVGFFAGLLVVFGVLIPWIVLAGVITGVVLLIVKRRSTKPAPVEPPAGP